MRSDEPRKYHHGDLRAALLSAAMEVLERDGPGGLSLRGLARSVGVSPMAPYHHFPDRTALLAAVATAGFERLQRRKLAARAAQPSPRAALAAGAADYVRFVLDNPNLYRLMKGSEFADRERHPDLHRAAAAPAELLIALVSDVLGARADAPTAEQGATMLWGLAHGLGMLALDEQIAPDLAPLLAEQGAAAMVDGWLAG